MSETTTEVKTPGIIANLSAKTLDKVLIDNWFKALFTKLSNWAFYAIIASPEIFQALTQLAGDANQQVLPAAFVSFIRTCGTIGLILRLVRQSKKTVEAEAKSEA